MPRLVLCALAAAALLPAAEWTRNYTVTGPAELRVESTDAAVHIRAGDTRQIEARVATRGWEIGPDEVRVIDHQTGNRVEIEVRVPRRTFSFGNRSVSVEVLVPRQTAAEVRTGDGGITVEGLHGAARLTTGDGRIVAEMHDGALEAKTGDGSVHVRGRFDVVNVHTGDGSIEVDARAGSRMAAPWRVNTGDGSVRLSLPTDLAADLDLHTGDGHVSYDFPLTVSGSASHSDVRAKLNGGGPSLVVRSGDGSISLARSAM